MIYKFIMVGSFLFLLFFGLVLLLVGIGSGHGNFNIYDGSQVLLVVFGFVVIAITIFGFVKWIKSN